MSKFIQHAKWRGEVLAYDIVRAIMMLFSFNAVSGFGGWLAKKIGPKTSKHHIVLTGLRTAFPDKSEAQINALALTQWDNTGRTAAEFPMLGRVRVFDNNSRVKVIGLEKLEALRDNNIGAVLISGHFANWEIMAAVFSQAGLPVRVTYRPTNNPYFDRRIRSQRQKYGIDLMVAKSGAKGAKELFTALRSGDSVALLNDQKFNEGIAVPFFGVPAMTAPGPTRMALKTGAPLVPMFVRRVERTKFEVEIYDPIKIENTGDRSADIERGVVAVTKWVEERILEAPAGWFWVHRRWDKSHYKK